MTEQNSFRKLAGWLAILSAPFAYVNFALTGIASGGDSQNLSNIYNFINVGEKAGNLMKWSWLSDFLGYYLLLVPAAFLLHYWLKKRNPYWMGIFTFCGLTYIFCGSVGAVILAKIWPTLITGYTNSSGVTKEIYGIVFTNSTEMVYGGMWSYLEFLLAGIWWIGVGFTLKQESRILGTVTIILGLFTLAAVVGEIFTLSYVTFSGFMVYLLLAPAWAGWLGITLLRKQNIQLEKP